MVGRPRRDALPHPARDGLCRTISAASTAERIMFSHCTFLQCAGQDSSARERP